MAAVSSTMLELGTPIPTFRLPDTDGTILSSEQFRDATGLLVAFICPHCPFVKHIRGGLAIFSHEYQKHGLPIVAINSNDPVASPDDGRTAMKKEIEEVGYSFPYLIDETQSVAKAFHAACTPDFFLFDRDRKLAYRGQFDAAVPATRSQSLGPTCGRLPTPSCPAALHPMVSSRASAATSNGSPATRPIILPANAGKRRNAGNVFETLLQRTRERAVMREYSAKQKRSKDCMGYRSLRTSKRKSAKRPPSRQSSRGFGILSRRNRPRAGRPTAGPAQT